MESQGARLIFALPMWQQVMLRLSVQTNVTYNVPVIYGTVCGRSFIIFDNITSISWPQHRQRIR